MHRLGWLALFLAALATASLGRAESPAATIAVIGDSLGDGMWSGLYRLVQKDKRYALYRGAKHSVGFTGSDLTDMIDRALAAGEVHAFVIMVGANDRRSFFVDGKSKALIRTPAWIRLYSDRVGAFMDYVGKYNAPLVWVLLPIMREEDATIDAEIINDIVTAAARTRPHVVLIETWGVTADENGAYRAHFADLTGTKRLMRASDGVHLEQPAYELFADKVLKQLRGVSPRFRQLAGP